MAGRVHQLIKELFALRGTGPSSQHFLRAHLVLSGINPDDHNESTQDDERKVAVLEKMLADFQQAPGAPASSRPRKDTIRR